jgi:hypothetical protein
VGGRRLVTPVCSVCSPSRDADFAGGDSRGRTTRRFRIVPAVQAVQDETWANLPEFS